MNLQEAKKKMQRSAALLYSQGGKEYPSNIDLVRTVELLDETLKYGKVMLSEGATYEDFYPYLAVARLLGVKRPTIVDKIKGWLFS